METQIARLFLNHSTSRLLDMMDLIDRSLNELPEDQIWRRDAGHQNAVGNLVLHLQGNVRQWIIAGIGGAADTRQREIEFSTQGGIDAKTLRANLRETVNSAVQVIGNLSPERLVDRVKPQDMEASVLEAIYRVVGHFQQHTGQIIFAAKLFSRP
jgi:uroporphyrinogen-III decarboxylase